jgi:hypothetical protein
MPKHKGPRMLKSHSLRYSSLTMRQKDTYQRTLALLSDLRRGEGTYSELLRCQASLGWTAEGGCPYVVSGGINNLAADDRGDHFAVELPAVERGVPGFRKGFGGIEGPLLFRVEEGDVGEVAAG